MSAARSILFRRIQVELWKKRQLSPLWCRRIVRAGAAVAIVAGVAIAWIYLQRAHAQRDRLQAAQIKAQLAAAAADALPGEGGSLFVNLSLRSVANLKLHKPLAKLEIDYADDQTIEQLAALPARKVIFRLGTNLTPAGWRRFVEFAPDVESLTFDPHHWDAGYAGTTEQKPSKFTDAVAAEVAKLKNLKSLELGSASITSAGLRQLAALKHLERLSILLCPDLAKNDLAPLVDFAALRSLELYFPLSAASLATLGKLDALEKIHFEIFMRTLRDGTRVGPEDLKPADFEPLAGMTALQVLDIGTEQMSGEGLFAYSKHAPADGIGHAASFMPNLRTFKLNGMVSHPISQESLRALAASPVLEDLEVGVAELDDDTLEMVSRIPHLRTLHLVPHKGNISDQGLAHLGKATGLVTLYVPGSQQITDAGLAHLASLTELETLNIGSTRITGAGLAVLRPLTKLKTFYLAGWPIERAPPGDDRCWLLPGGFPEPVR